MSMFNVTVVCSPKSFTKDSYACIVYGHTKVFTRTCTDGGKQNFEFLIIDGFGKLEIAVCSHDGGLIGRAQVQLGKDISKGYNDFWCSVHSQGGELAGEVRLITHLDESFGQESAKGNYQELASIMSLPSFSRHIPQLSQTFKEWKLKPAIFKCVQCSSTALEGYKSLNGCDSCGHKWETDKEDFFDVISVGMEPDYILLAFVLKQNRSSLQLLCDPIKDGFPVNLVGMEYDDSGGGQAADHQACIPADENGETYKDDSLKQKMGVGSGILLQNAEDVRINMAADESAAEQLEILCNLVKRLAEDKTKTDSVLSTIVLASSTQGATSLISAGSSAVPWILVAANAVAFTASLTSVCLGGKKPPVSILLSKFGTAALVTVVMGITYMYLPVYLKWLAGLGCAIPIAAIIYT